MNTSRQFSFVVGLAVTVFSTATSLSVNAQDHANDVGILRETPCNRGPKPSMCPNSEIQRRLIYTVIEEHKDRDDRVRNILNKLQNVNFVNDTGFLSPLSFAIIYGTPELVAILLSKGADPLALDIYGNLILNTTIEVACKKNPFRPQIVGNLRMALDKARALKRLPPKPPLDASLVFYPGKTKPELLKVLVEYGANPNMKGKNGRPLELAIRYKVPEAIPVLAQAKFAVDKAELDAAAYEVYWRHETDLLTALRSVGADPARYAKNNPQALFNALSPKGGADVLEFVLKSGANPNTRQNMPNATPLLAAQFDPEKMRLLLKYGADPNFKARGVDSILARVLFYPQKKIPVPQFPAAGQTPRLYDKLAIVKLLLEYGADINTNISDYSNGQWGALGLTRREDEEVIDLLIKHGATLNHEIGSPLLISLTPREAARIVKAPGPVTLAIMMERDDLALALIARDRKIGAKDRYALLEAVRRGWREVAEALLRAGADPNTADAKGVTPLSLAQRRRADQLAKMLIDAGAKPSAPPPPLRVAGSGGNFETTAAMVIHEVVHLDPPRFTLGGTKSASFGFYGKQPQQFEDIKCEHSAEFTIILNANIVGGVSAGVCHREAKRIRELMPAAKTGVDMSLKSFSKAGVKIDRVELKRLGWIYEKSIGPDRSEIFYFPLLMVSHGIIAASTTVMVSEKGDKAVIIQANVMNLCDESRNMKSQTVLCSNTQNAVTEIAQRLSLRFKDK